MHWSAAISLLSVQMYIKINRLLDRRSHLRFDCSHGLVQINCNSLRPCHVYTHTNQWQQLLDSR